MSAKRYTTYSMNVAGRPMHYVVDSQNNGQEMFRSRDKQAAEGRADTLNRQATETTTETPAATPAQTATTAPATGWSTAARRRAGQPHRSHPLGQVVEAGHGYTVYEDTAFGGGRVQIWDES